MGRSLKAFAGECLEEVLDQRCGILPIGEGDGAVAIGIRGKESYADGGAVLNQQQKSNGCGCCRAWWWAVYHRRCVCRATLIDAGAVSVAGHGIGIVDWSAADDAFVPRSICATGDVAGAGKRDCVDRALLQHLTGFRQGLSCRPH